MLVKGLLIVTAAVGLLFTTVDAFAGVGSCLVGSHMGFSSLRTASASSLLSRSSAALGVMPLRDSGVKAVMRKVGVSGAAMDLDWYKCEKLDELPGGGNKYRFTVDVDGKITKSSFAVVMKEFKKTARFPGFRVGTVPPFMVTKVKQFVILECLEKTLGEAVADQQLELASDKSKPTLDDDQVTALTKSFKDGEPFTYIIDADLKLKAGAISEASAVVDASEAIIDVEAN